MYYMGVDIGSTSSKAVIIDQDKKILSNIAIQVGTGTSGPKRAVEEALRHAGLSKEDIALTVVTGYGRIIFKEADKQVTEISCHAKGVHHLIPSARTVIDIGGQDAKTIKLDEGGRVVNFVMNEKCAAGTGRFLEVMTRVLECDVAQLSQLSSLATEEVMISSTCTVFAESEVISQLALGSSRENVALGIHKSVARRVAGLAKRIGIIPDVVMTGGVAMNTGVVRALEEELGVRITVVPQPQTVGALGAALFALEENNKC